PALRLPAMAADVRLDELPALAPGRPLRIRGRLPEHLSGARVRVSLERTPGSAPVDLQPLPAQPGAERDRVLRSNHDRATRFGVDEKEATAADGRFEVNLEAPARIPWPALLLRVYARTEKQESMVVERLRAPRPGKTR